MKKTILSALVAFAITTLPALALVSENENASFLVISNLQGKAGDKQVALSWNASADKNGYDAESYTIEYGKQSVAEGLTNTYEESTSSTSTEINISDLTNGVPYYFVVKANSKDAVIGKTSEEIKVTPTSGSETETVSAPSVISAESEDTTIVVVEFSEEIILPSESPELSFSITEEDDTSQYLLVWDAEFYKENEGKENETIDKTKVKLTTDEQIIDKSYTVTVSALITDLDNNPIESGATDSATFIGTEKVEVVAEDVPNDTEHAAAEEDVPMLADEDLVADEVPVDIDTENIEEKDTTPPEDVTNLAIKFKQRVTDYLMQLTWAASVNTAGDLVNQLVYHSLDKGTNWDKPVLLADNATSYDMVGQPETEHTFKITAKDLTGNESGGVIESIRLPALPQTGPLALVLFGAGLTAAGFSRIRKK